MPTRLFSDESTSRTGAGLSDGSHGFYEQGPPGWKATGMLQNLIDDERIDYGRRRTELLLLNIEREESRVLDNDLFTIYHSAEQSLADQGGVDNKADGGTTGTGKLETTKGDFENDFYVTEEQLLQIFPQGNKQVLKELASKLNAKMKTYGIRNEIQLAHFLAQSATETGEFKKYSVTENLNYSQQGLLNTFKKYFGKGKRDASVYARNAENIANYVYSDRMGNGDEQSGDGYKYRGRGLIQLTGKSNYQAFTDFYHGKHPEASVNFVENPSLVADNFDYAVESALWFFQDRVNVSSVNFLSTVDKVTAKVNGGTNGLAERKKIYKRALLYLYFLPYGIAK